MDAGGPPDTGGSDAGDAGTGDALLPGDAGPDYDGGPMGTDPPVYLRGGRPNPESCDHVREPTEVGARMCGCSSDAECTEGEDGRCSIDHDVRFCTYDECFEDSDCPEGQACACNASPYGANVCLPALCVTDADCGALTCGLHRNCGGGSGRTGPPIEFRCHTPMDECTVDADCGDPTMFCAWGGPDPGGGWIDDRWLCNRSCAIGPPMCPP